MHEILFLSEAILKRVCFSVVYALNQTQNYNNLIKNKVRTAFESQKDIKISLYSDHTEFSYLQVCKIGRETL